MQQVSWRDIHAPQTTNASRSKKGGVNLGPAGARQTGQKMPEMAGQGKGRGGGQSMSVYRASQIAAILAALLTGMTQASQSQSPDISLIGQPLEPPGIYYNNQEKAEINQIIKMADFSDHQLGEVSARKLYDVPPDGQPYVQGEQDVEATKSTGGRCWHGSFINLNGYDCDSSCSYEVALTESPDVQEADFKTLGPIDGFGKLESSLSLFWQIPQIRLCDKKREQQYLKRHYLTYRMVTQDSPDDPKTVILAPHRQTIYLNYIKMDTVETAVIYTDAAINQSITLPNAQNVGSTPPGLRLVLSTTSEISDQVLDGLGSQDAATTSCVYDSNPDTRSCTKTAFKDISVTGTESLTLDFARLPSSEAGTLYAHLYVYDETESSDINDYFFAKAITIEVWDSCNYIHQEVLSTLPAEGLAYSLADVESGAMSDLAFEDWVDEVGSGWKFLPDTAFSVHQSYGTNYACGPWTFVSATEIEYKVDSAAMKPADINADLIETPADILTQVGSLANGSTGTASAANFYSTEIVIGKLTMKLGNYREYQASASVFLTGATVTWDKDQGGELEPLYTNTLSSQVITLPRLIRTNASSSLPKIYDLFYWIEEVSSEFLKVGHCDQFSTCIWASRQESNQITVVGSLYEATAAALEFSPNFPSEFVAKHSSQLLYLYWIAFDQYAENQHSVVTYSHWIIPIAEPCPFVTITEPPVPFHHFFTSQTDPLSWTIDKVRTLAYSAPQYILTNTNEPSMFADTVYTSGAANAPCTLTQTQVGTFTAEPDSAADMISSVETDKNELSYLASSTLSTITSPVTYTWVFNLAVPTLASSEQTFTVTHTYLTSVEWSLQGNSGTSNSYLNRGAPFFGFTTADQTFTMPTITSLSREQAVLLDHEIYIVSKSENSRLKSSGESVTTLRATNRVMYSGQPDGFPQLTITSSAESKKYTFEAGPKGFTLDEPMTLTLVGGSSADLDPTVYWVVLASGEASGSSLTYIAQASWQLIVDNPCHAAMIQSPQVPLHKFELADLNDSLIGQLRTATAQIFDSASLQVHLVGDGFDEDLSYSIGKGESPGFCIKNMTSTLVFEDPATQQGQISLELASESDANQFYITRLDQNEWDYNVHALTMQISTTFDRIHGNAPLEYLSWVVIGSDCSQSTDLVSWGPQELQEGATITFIQELEPWFQLTEPLLTLTGAGDGRLCSMVEVVDSQLALAMIELKGVETSHTVTLSYTNSYSYFDEQDQLVPAKSQTTESNAITFTRVSICEQPELMIALPHENYLRDKWLPMFGEDRAQFTWELENIVYTFKEGIDTISYSALPSSSIPLTQQTGKSKPVADLTAENGLREVCHPTHATDSQYTLFLGSQAEWEEASSGPMPSTLGISEGDDCVDGWLLGQKNIQQCISPWTRDLEGTTVTHTAVLVDSNYPNLYMQLQTEVKYQACSNLKALEKFGLEPVQDFEDLGLEYPLFGPPFNATLPQSANYCSKHLMVFGLAEGSAVTFANGTSVPLKELDQLDGFGFTLEEAHGDNLATDLGIDDPSFQMLPPFILTLESQDFSLIGSIFDLTFVSQVPNSPDIKTTTHLQILIQQPVCPVDRLLIEELADGLQRSYALEATYAKPAIHDLSQIKLFFDSLASENPLWETICGTFVYVFAAKAQFVSFSPESSALGLYPQPDTPVGPYPSVASLSVKLSGIGLDQHSAQQTSQQKAIFTVKIDAFVLPCIVQTLEFSTKTLSLSYEVSQGQLLKSLPELKQEPACDFALAGYRIVPSDSETSSLVSQVATLDLPAEGEPSLAIYSNNQTHMGASIQFEVYADLIGQVEKAIPLKVILALETVKLGLKPNQAGDPKVPDLTCSQADANWSYTLPTVIPETDVDVLIKFTPSSADQSLFTYLEDSRTITIAKEKLSKVMTGELCPAGSVELIELPFELSSAQQFDDGEATIFVRVRRQEEFEFEFKAEYKEAEKSDEVEQIKLAVEKLSVTVDGKLRIEFNKAIVTPYLKTNQTTVGEVDSEPGDEAYNRGDSPERRRRLMDTTAGEEALYDIRDVIQIEVDGEAQEDEEYDKRIERVTLEKVDERTLQIWVEFKQPNDITPEVKEPDVLKVKFILPNLILDAENLEPFETEAPSFNVVLQPQLSAEEMEQAQAVAAAIAVVGTGVVIWQVIMLIALGKALHSMWILINSLQFFVYMSMWQVKYPLLVKVVLTELRRIALGELIDDLDLANKVKSFLGMPVSDPNETSFTEKVGLDRLGPPDIALNFGPTLIVISGVLLLLVILAMGLYKIAKKTQLSAKWTERLKKIKRKVFQNPMIRFHLLNALKLNVTGCLAIAYFVQGEEGASIPQLLLGSAMLLALNVLPCVYLKVVRKNFPLLTLESKEAKYGTLYKGIDVKVVNKKLWPEAKNHAHIYTPVFLARRTLFALGTVSLFDYPNLQFMAHQVTTLAYLAFLNNEAYHMYETSERRRIEVASELLALWASVFLQLMQVQSTSDAANMTLEVGFLALLGLLFCLNVAFVISTVCAARAVKRRHKQLLNERAKNYEIAAEEAKERQRIQDQLAISAAVAIKMQLEEERLAQKEEAERQQVIKGRTSSQFKAEMANSLLLPIDEIALEQEQSEEASGHGRLKASREEQKRPLSQLPKKNNLGSLPNDNGDLDSIISDPERYVSSDEERPVDPQIAASLNYGDFIMADHERLRSDMLQHPGHEGRRMSRLQPRAEPPQPVYVPNQLGLLVDFVPDSEIPPQEDQDLQDGGRRPLRALQGSLSRPPQRFFSKDSGLIDNIVLSAEQELALANDFKIRHGISLDGIDPDLANQKRQPKLKPQSTLIMAPGRKY